MPDPIVWKDEYLIHMHAIDEQHKYLFRLVNHLVESSQSDYSGAIAQLLSYTQEHFRDEEQLMLAIDFPELERHQKLHQDLINYLNKLDVKQLQQAEPRRKFESFLGSWLVEHIVKEDMKIKEL